MDAIKRRWKPVEVNLKIWKSLWKLVEVGGSRWKSMKVGGSRHGSSWKSMGQMEADGSQLKSGEEANMEGNGLNGWKWVEVHMEVDGSQ